MLKYFLFGSLQIIQNYEPLALPTSVAARSLLSYLLLNKDTPHSRLALAGTLFPENEESLARRKLSQSLWQLRNTVPDLVETDRHTIQVIEKNIWVDVNAFQELSKSEETISQAVELYTGELLPGFYDDWVILRREQLRETYLKSLERLVILNKRAGEFENALEYSQRLLEADPFQESVHHEVMRLYMALEQPLSALRQFKTCRQILKAELGAEPNPATIQLAEEITRKIAQETLTIPHQIETPTKVRGQLSPQTLPLVGRGAERRALLTHIDRVLDGQGGLVLIEGEAGVGKTRLLQEIASDADWRGIQVLWGYGREMEVTSLYGPLVEALESGLTSLRVGQLIQIVDKPWIQAVKALLPTLASHLPELPPPPSSNLDKEQSRLLEALNQFLAAWTKITPLVVILENLHWIDYDTLDILPGLVRRMSSEGILLIATYRGEEARTYPILWDKIQTIDRAGLRERIILPRLNASATGELIRGWLDFSVEAPLFESRLFQETEGNPLFVLETLRALQEESLLTQDESGQWSTPWDETTDDYLELPIPSLVEDVIYRRISRLLPPERQTLNLAAILGSTFDYLIFHAVMEQDASTALFSLRKLVQRQLLEETSTGYQFTHDKILQVAYQKISPETRVHFHRKAGQALERIDSEKAAELARHFYRGELWEPAVRYKQQAGEQAEDIYAHYEALKHYSDGLKACDHLPKNHSVWRSKLLFGREKIYGILGNREAQASDLIALNACVQNKADKATLALSWARYYDDISDFQSMHRCAKEVIRLATEMDDLQMLFSGQIEASHAIWLQGDYAEAEKLLESAVQNAQQAGNIRQEAIVNLKLGHLYYDKGKYKQALFCYEAVIPLFEQVNDLFYLGTAFNSLGNINDSLGNQLLAIEYYKKSIQIRKALGDQRGYAIALYNIGMVYHVIGDDKASFQHIQESVAICQTLGDQRVVAYGLNYLGYLLDKNDPQQASEYYQQSLDIRREIGQWALTTDCLSGLARAALTQGNYQKAKEYIQCALDWIDKNDIQGVGDVLLMYKSAFEVYSAC
ncbi:MAG: hypothetical protein B6I38_06700, partial [Anaerolineaceae bacterium 4572_5.1]